MGPEVARALEALVLRLQAAGIPVLLGGSGLLHALGLGVAVRDVDLMGRPEDREAVERAAGAWWRETVTTATPLFRSPWKAVLDVDGVEAEVLGGLAYAAEGRVVTVPFRAAGTWRCGAAEVGLAPPEHWLLLYERYRPERARQLAPLVDAAALARARAELGLA